MDGMLERHQLFVSFYRAFQRFQKALDIVLPDAPDLEDEERYAWVTCLDKTSTQIERAVDTPIIELAKFAFDSYQAGKVHEDKPPEFEALSPPQALAWKCLVRHLANLLVYDVSEDGDPLGHEERMEAFFTAKLQELLVEAKGSA